MDWITYELEVHRDRIRRLTALLDAAQGPNVQVADVRACLCPTPEQEQAILDEMRVAVEKACGDTDSSSKKS